MSSFFTVKSFGVVLGVALQVGMLVSQVHAQRAVNPQPLAEKSIDGDWTISGEETIRDKHIRLDGTLVLPEGAKLTLENCVLEIVGEYSRQHSVEFKGGTLVTKNCEVGGFVNDAGTAIHTVFHLYEGLWEAIDTTVSYSYGISFHWEKGKGVLRGTRMKAGPRPDAIILSGEADVELVDSDFPIGLGVYVDQGGKTTVDLQPSQTLTATFDRSTLLPGVNWRLDMKNTRVERWFLFVRNIGGWHPPAKITLASSKDLIVSLLGHNLQGQAHLTPDLSQPLKIGNVTVTTQDGRPAGISMYGLYLSGADTDLTITGMSHVCELMQRGGRLRFKGTPQTDDVPLSIGCTTLELSGDATLELEDVHLGRPLTWQTENNIGEANVKGNAQLRGNRVSINNVRFRTELEGEVALTNVDEKGIVESAVRGGSIVIGKGGQRE